MAFNERYINPYTDVQADIAKYSPEELREYEASMKDYWDFNSTMETSFGKGKKEGKMEGKMEEKIETARKMKSDGLSSDFIAKYTGLTPEQIEALA